MRRAGTFAAVSLLAITVGVTAGNWTYLSAQVPVYYPDCASARAAAAAPMNRDAPGYRAALDADDDGIACEPYIGE